MPRAFIIYHDAFECVSVYAAETRGKAVAAIYTDARDAGYEAVKWTDFRAKRAPIFDAIAKPGRYALGYHARSYSLGGDFTGYDQYGCLDGYRKHPRDVYDKGGSR